MKYALTFDSTPSVRTKDENGFLHVALTPISKATVNPYLGKEIAVIIKINSAKSLVLRF